MSSKKTPNNPFPGLFPYALDQSNDFFSREKEVESILEILQKNRLVTISSNAGTGKSSIINAGIIPRLINGFPGQSGRDWAICKFRPGISPIKNICSALVNKGTLYNDNKAKSTDFDEYLKIIEKEGQVSLINIYKSSDIYENKNLLIVIDQIEDLFIYNKFFDHENSDDDNLLIDIIYKTIKTKDIAIYFIINVQTPYVANLNVYGQFSEILSSSQYVLPNIDFNNLLEQLTSKYQNFNINFSNEAFDYINNLIHETTSLLPNLQLLISNLYNNKYDNDYIIDINEIKKTGALKLTISNHLEGFFNKLSEKEKNIFKLVFKGMVHADEYNKNNFYQNFGYLKYYTKTNSKELSHFINKINNEVGGILDVFSENISDIKPLKNKNFLESDIIYLKYNESFNWEKLRKWIKEEQDDFELYIDYSNKANQYPEKESLLKKHILVEASKWLNQKNINKEWASKYDFDFNKTRNFIQDSIKKNEIEKTKNEIEEKIKERNKRLVRMGPWIFLFLGAITCLVTFSDHYKIETLLEDYQKKESLYNNLEKRKDSLNTEIDEFKNSKILFVDTIESYRSQHRSDSIKLIQKNTRIIKEEQALKKEQVSLRQKGEQIDSLVEANKIAEKFINISTDEINFNNQISNLNTEIKLVNPFEEDFEDRIEDLIHQAIKIYDNYKELTKVKRSLTKNRETNQLNETIYHSIDDENDRNNLREVALNIIAKINKVDNYTDINKFNLLDKHRPNSLNTIAISNEGRFATGGKNKTVFVSREKLNIQLKENIVFDKITFESHIKTITFIDEQTLCVGLANGHIWYSNFKTKTKARIYPQKIKRKHLDEIKKIEFVSFEKSIFAINSNELIKYNLPEKQTYRINFDDMEKHEKLEDIAFNKKNYLFISTSKGNIYNYNIVTQTHSKINRNDLNFSSGDLPAQIEFYNNNLLIGTQNGWIYEYEMNGNSLSYINRTLSHKTEITDLYYDAINKKIYSASLDGSFTISPTNNESNKNHNTYQKIIIKLGRKNQINAIGYTKHKNENYIITVDKNGKMIYWDFNIDNLFNRIKQTIISKN
tara:strand:+ start:1610 stop:4789 length:3180 start_codon:yes stop_codon:yes gene_type:complete